MTATNFEQDLRHRLTELADHAPASPSRPHGDLAPYPQPPARRPPTRHLVLAIAAAVAVVAVLVTAVWRIADHDPDPNVITDTRLEPAPPTTLTPPTTDPALTTTTAAPGSIGAVTDLPHGPGYGRTFPAAVWTGTELLVWGGEVVSELEWSNAGGAYNPTTRSWRPLAPSPLPAMSEHSAVWTGTEMLICCGRTRSAYADTAGAYRPDTDTWRTIAAPPFDGAPFAQSVWTGREMLVVGGSQYRGAAAYDPATDRWRTLADPPAIIERRADSAWTGDSLVVWNRDDYSGTGGMTYDVATDTWERLPDMPDDLRFEGGTASVVGDELIIWGAKRGPDGLAHATSAALDLGTRRWRALPGLPIEPVSYTVGTNTSPSSVSSGSEAIVSVGDFNAGPGPGSLSQPGVPVVAYNPTTQTWRPLGGVSQGHNSLMVWAGTRAYIIGEDFTVVVP